MGGWVFLGSRATLCRTTLARSTVRSLVPDPLPLSRCTPSMTVPRTIGARYMTQSTMIILVTPSQRTPRALTPPTHGPRSPSPPPRTAPHQGQEEDKPTTATPSTTTTCPRETSDQAVGAIL